MRAKNFTFWLDFFQKNYPCEIDLGLERIRAVAEKLKILKFDVPIITITGTNGKGSCVAILENIYLSANYKVGSFTSPYIWRFNEQVRINFDSHLWLTSYSGRNSEELLSRRFC